MYPDFSYILHGLFGLPPDNVFAVIKTFGLFLGFAFAASAGLAYLELKRKESRGVLKGIEEDVLTYQPLTLKNILLQSLIQFILFSKLIYALQHGKEFIADPASVIFSSKGSYGPGMFVAGIAFLYSLFKMNRQTDHTAQYQRMLIKPHERIVDITTLAAIYGLIGSKLFSILENFESFAKDPIGEFFSGSGLTIYGGLILAFIMVYRYVQSKGMKPLHVMDAVAPALMIGYCVGRMGCHLSGDGDWGIVNEMVKPGWFIFPDSWWINHYPHNVLKEGLQLENCSWEYCKQLVPGVFPTPLYEVILAGLITGFLWILRVRIHRAGVLFFTYCLLNGLERFFIEFIRVNPRYHFFGFDLSQAQFIALGLVLTGIVGILYYWKKNIPN